MRQTGAGLNITRPRLLKRPGFLIRRNVYGNNGTRKIYADGYQTI